MQEASDKLNIDRAEDQPMEWLCRTRYKVFDQGQQLCTVLQSAVGTKLLTCIPSGQRLLRLVAAVTSKATQAGQAPA